MLHNLVAIVLSPPSRVEVRPSLTSLLGFSIVPQGPWNPSSPIVGKAAQRYITSGTLVASATSHFSVMRVRLPKRYKDPVDPHAKFQTILANGLKWRVTLVNRRHSLGTFLSASAEGEGWGFLVEGLMDGKVGERQSLSAIAMLKSIKPSASGTRR